VATRTTERAVTAKPAPLRRFRRKREPSKLPFYVILVLLAVYSLGPLLVLVFNSLKSPAERGRNPLGPPVDPVFSNFPNAWETGNLATTIRNSTILAVGTIVGVWLIAGLAAYALARLRPRGSVLILTYLVASTAIPVQLFVVPLFFLWIRLNLINTYLGLIIIYCALFSPFATLLLRSYFVALPKEFEEAARVDGASELTVLRKIVIPLAWPGFLTVGLLVGLWAWNEFFFALTFLQDQNLFPVTTSFLEFQQEFRTDFGLTSAAGIIIILPFLLLFLGLQRKFVAGLTSAGLKG
jgi:raffinose/stachyose/melibiose transport system permease protein